MTCRQHIMIMIGAEPLGSYAPRFISIHPELIAFAFTFSLRAPCVTIIHWDLIRLPDRPHLVLLSVDWPST